MRTKTKVLLAAMVVAGAVTASAQVYSVNVVGYVNVVVKPGFNFLANPLDNKNTGLNTVANLLVGLPGDAYVYKWVNGKFEPTNGYEGGEWGNPNQVLDPGQGFWLESMAAADAALTFVGEVKQGHLVTPYIKGFNMVGSQVPQKGLLTTDLKFQPAEGCDAYVYQYKGGYLPTRAWEGGGPWDTEPTIDVAEGFWLETTAAGDWVRDFSVN